MKNRPQQIGNYIIEQKIGKGATSEVWLARHRYLKRQTAIKLLLSQDEEAIERFTREANLVCHFSHPNIVRIFDHGYEEPFYYAVLEYIEGHSLFALLEKQPRLDLVRAVTIFRQIADALDYAHSYHVIHRDVSPGNILVEDKTGRALLTDFGIARDINHTMTVVSNIMGTPGYWSPEHTQSATDVTHLSDLYGLGVVFYVMLTGTLPWEDAPGLHHQPFQPPIPLRQHGLHHLPAQVEHFFQTMLAVEPERRFSSGEQAVAELDRILNRHRAVTQTTSATSARNQKRAALNTTETFEAGGIEPNEVEEVLGNELSRQHMKRAHERADALCQPSTIAALLDTWSRQGFRGGVFRRALLGRVARLHRVHSYNLYFYRLQVLFEERGEPKVIEEPDRNPEPLSLEPEQDRWQVTLPSIQIFQDNLGSQVNIPGSARVVSCQKCGGKGKIICARCKGHGRVPTKRTVPVVEETVSPDTPPSDNQHASRGEPSQGGKPRGRQKAAGSGVVGTVSGQTPSSGAGAGTSGNVAAAASIAPRTRTETVLGPCPGCDGRGGHTCEHCEGTGRMVQHKAFRWQRIAREVQDHDELPPLDEKWMSQTCEAVEIYNERIIGDPQSPEAAFRHDWSDIPRLKSLIDSMQQATSEHRRIILSEVTISMIPCTDITFDLGDTSDDHDPFYNMTLYGFDNAIPTNWSLLDWERVLFFWVVIFLVIVTAIFGYFAFTA